MSQINYIDKRRPHSVSVFIKSSTKIQTRGGISHSKELSECERGPVGGSHHCNNLLGHLQVGILKCGSVSEPEELSQEAAAQSVHIETKH